MPQITSITPQKKDKSRCNIELDGRFFCGMKLETAVRYGLKAGKTVSEEELSQMQLESEKATALDKALLHITASMKTEREIRDFLKKKGFLQDTADHVVEKMREYGFLDDDAYASAYVESASKNKGARLIALELKRKGISDEQAAKAVEGLDGVPAAKRVLEKYLRGKDVSDRKVLQRAYAHLLSKGFDYDTAKEALAATDPDED